MNDVRYVWNIKYVRKIYKSIPFAKEEAIELPFDDQNIFVNIYETRTNGFDTFYRVKLFYADGETFEGWTTDIYMPIGLFHEEKLFDGRFNS